MRAALAVQAHSGRVKWRMGGPPIRWPGNFTSRSDAEAPCSGRENVTVSHPPRRGYQGYGVLGW